MESDDKISVKKCTYNIVKNVNDNDSGNVSSANGDEKRKYAHKKVWKCTKKEQMDVQN